MPRSARFISLLIATLAISLAGCAQVVDDAPLPQPPTIPAPTLKEPEAVFRICHEAAEHSALDQALLAFATEVAEQSDGRLTVELYPDSRLGSADKMLEAVSYGFVDALLISPPHLAWALAELELDDPGWLGLLPPFAYTGAEAVMEAVMEAARGEAGQSLNSSLSALGLTSLGWLPGEQRAFAVDQRALYEPEDLRGLNIALLAEDFDYTAPMLKTFGADPRQTVFWRIPGAIEEGKLNAWEAPLSRLWQQRVHSAAPHITLTGHSFELLNILVNTANYTSLDPNLRACIDAALPALTETLRRLNTAEQDDLLRRFIEDGAEVTALGEEAQAAFRAALGY